jgi:DNA-binding response OmpR family regulator
MEELEMRIEAVLRRTKGATQEETKNHFTIGKYEFDYLSQQLKIGKTIQDLTTKEAELLKLFCLNLNNLVEREIALKLIWGNDSYFTGRSMDVFITKLRKYLKDDTTVEIANVHGTGYKLIIKN